MEQEALVNLKELNLGPRDIVRDPVVLEFLRLPNAGTLDDCIPQNPCKIYAFFSATLQSKNSILHVIGRTLPFSDPGIAERNR
ncbi:hypothetical protein SAMN03159290_01571 [Pseudomonas sp. NFACC13-1]|nr:hypothetical protein SAMN03159290_01571 [Pseudomonas sp. NFACC13-1]